MQTTIRHKSQQLWLRAIKENITLQFTNPADMHRARFALYDACRKTDNSELLAAKEQIEISVNKKTLTLTMRRRDENPFHGMLEEQLDQALGQEAPLGMVGQMDPARDAEESLRRFQEKICQEEKGIAEQEKRPATPYFRRD